MADPSDSTASRDATRRRALAGYRHATSREAGCGELLEAWADGTAEEWLELVQSLVLQRDEVCAARVLDHALELHPLYFDLRQAQAGLLQQQGDIVAAERKLRELLQEPHAPRSSRFVLARLLKEQGRMRAAAEVLRAGFEASGGDLAQRIQAVELLDDCGRKSDAAFLCEVEIAAGCPEPALHAYAAMLLSQLGQFELARARYEFVVSHSDRAPEWHVPLGLAGLQRYRDETHPDFGLFRRYLATVSDDDSRTSLLFALGKAHDDIGDYAEAARLFSEANARAAGTRRWSRKLWRRSVDMRGKRRLPGPVVDADPSWAPVFVVGVPRSGTTLVARLLASRPGVCHRGELPWLPNVAEQVKIDAGDFGLQLQNAAAIYAPQLRQDDADGAHWFIDKQPQNFLHVDLALALFPNARIIQCRRTPRDTALSLWMQSFHDRSLDFAYDFTDIAAYIRGAHQLMSHWQARFPDQVRTLDYEDLVADPAACLSGLADWLGLPPGDAPRSGNHDDPISTASLWQARQPIHARSVARWRAYAPHLPGLLQVPAA